MANQEAAPQLSSLNANEYSVTRNALTFLPGTYQVEDVRHWKRFYATHTGFLWKDVELVLESGRPKQSLLIKSKSLCSSAYEMIDTAPQTGLGTLVCENRYKESWQILDPKKRPLAHIRRINLAPFQRQAECRVFLRNQIVCTYRLCSHLVAIEMRVNFCLDVREMLDKRLGIAAAIAILEQKGHAQGA